MTRQRPAPGDPASPAPPSPAPPEQPRLAARINLTLPLTSSLGLAEHPGLVAGFGPVDAPLARHLTGLAPMDPATRFCITLTDQEGRALGHGCLPGPGGLNQLTTRGLTLAITPITQDACDHRGQEPGYQPSRKLQHLIWARTPTCTAPGCRRPAVRSDLDHTIPYDQGGRTCECNLAPLCPMSGTRWTTPAGRHYLTVPDLDP